MIAYVSDPETMATVDGRDYRTDPGAYLQAGEPVNRRTTLDTRGAGELRTGRATFPAPGGTMLDRTATRRIGAMSAPSTRANDGDTIGRMMRNPDGRKRRPVTRGTLSLTALNRKRRAAGLKPLRTLPETA